MRLFRVIHSLRCNLLEVVQRCEMETIEMKKITIEMLTQMTPEQRAQMYQNALERLDSGGREVVDLIDSSGLPLRSGGMKMTDPVYLRMEEIIWSVDGKKAMVEATEAGLPALAGVEPLIVGDLGNRYQPHDLGTVSAGSIVGEVMRHLGYEKQPDAKMPEGSVAKTAATWKPISR